jgi:ABC-type multidrug transport system ATPase subunit
MDHELERIIIAHIRSALRDSAIVFVTHRLAAAGQFDRVLLISDREIEVLDSVDELLSRFSGETPGETSIGPRAEILAER